MMARICALVISVAALISPVQPMAAQAPGSTAAGTASALSPGAVFGTWHLSSDHSTTIVVRNTDRQNSASGTLVLFAADGQVAGKLPVQVAPNSAARLNVAELLMNSASASQRGGFLLQFPTIQHVRSQALVRSVRSGSVLVLPADAGSALDTENALHAPWWLPDEGTTGTLVLFNTSEQTVNVSPATIVNGEEKTQGKVVLAAHQTRELSLADLLSNDKANTGSLVLRYNGPAHALEPALVLENPSNGFAFSPRFEPLHEPAIAQSGATVVFPEVLLATPGAGPVTPLRAFAVLENSRRQPLNVTLGLDFSVTGDRKPHHLSVPIAPLDPRETRVLDLSQTIDTELAALKAKRLGVTFSHQGSPGDLNVNVLSASDDRNTVLSSAAATIPGNSVQTAYFDLLRKSGIVSQLKNPGTAESHARAMLIFATSTGIGTYTLPDITVQANRAARLNVETALNSNIPDSTGNFVPPAISSGLVVLSTSSAALAGTAGADTLHFAQTVSGTAAAAACTVPCTISVSRSSLTQTSSTGSPGGGRFTYASALLSGQLPPTYTTPNASANPNTGNITAPANPQAAPSAGGLAQLTAEYHCTSGETNVATFRAATFGLSCYILADENDFIAANGSCKSLTIAGTRYSGVSTNPPGLPAGDYCTAFLGDVRLQGSGSTRGGTKIHYLSGTNPTWQFQVVAQFTGADGTALIPNGSVARDRSIVPRNTNVQLQTGNFVANDTGGAIRGYRLDVFGGSGRASCATFSNIMTVGGCSPAVRQCPGPSDH